MVTTRDFVLWLVLAVVVTAGVTATLTADVISHTRQTVVIHRTAPRVHYFGTD